ncbi:MAG: YrdB family protein [Kofleriaceae bacterium]|nr:YrdB family protein [Kofleriaceae bacterium]MCB9572820.1 YrdB family protein [Kofleriaceae bacterium]
MGALVLTLRFALELGALGALGWWGATGAGASGAPAIALAIVLPAIAATWWGAWVAPRARRRLRDPARFAAELVVWAPATLALLDLTAPAIAIGFAALALATAVGARRHEPAPPPR